MGEELEITMRGLLGVAQSVLAELDVDVVLDRVLEAARELSGARYAALGVLNASGTGLARFLTAGVEPGVARAIGHPPEGKGLLGEVIRDPRPLRVADVGSHPRSYGFPLGHPPMRTFLGVPVAVAGEPFGNLYLTDKYGGGGFSDHDEEALVVLAQFAGLAIDHARRYAHAEARRSELQRAVDALDATVQVSRALAGQTDLDKVLALVAKRARALVRARMLIIGLCEHGDLVVGAAAGDVPDGLIGQRLRLHGTVANAAIVTLATQRLGDQSTRAGLERDGLLGRLGVHAHDGLVVPLTRHGHAYGVLVALNRRDGPAGFAGHDQQLLEWFAASAATVLVSTLAASAERERVRLSAAEQERERWSRELHDGTLQRLAALRLELAGARRAGTLTELDATASRVLDALRDEITTLRSISFDLRPRVLDQLGTEAAIRSVCELAEADGIATELDLNLAHEQGRQPVRHTPELEATIYRIVQEALANAYQHGRATHVTVTVNETETTVTISVCDNGTGFDPADIVEGFGLLGLRERVRALRGQLRITSTPRFGTTISASLPVRLRPAANDAQPQSNSAVRPANR